jgi:hypothetical protein
MAGCHLVDTRRGASNSVSGSRQQRLPIDARPQGDLKADEPPKLNGISPARSPGFARLVFADSAFVV